MARDTRPPQYENYEEQDKGLGLGSAGLAALLSAGAIATPVGKPVRAALGKVIPQSVKDYALKQAGAAAKAMNLEGGTLDRARKAANAAGPASPNFKDSWQNLKATGAALKAGGNSIWKDAKEGLFGPTLERGAGTQLEMDLVQPTGPRVFSNGTAGPRITSSVPVPKALINQSPLADPQGQLALDLGPMPVKRIPVNIPEMRTTGNLSTLNPTNLMFDFTSAPSAVVQKAATLTPMQQAFKRVSEMDEQRFLERLASTTQRRGGALTDYASLIRSAKTPEELSKILRRTPDNTQMTLADILGDDALRPQRKPRTRKTKK